MNFDINTYMVGYSKFLRLFSVFTTSDFALIAFQYLFIQSSALYFLFTIFYFYKPTNVFQIVLLGFIVLNPLFLYMSNYVSSDALFLALSLTWFTLLLWIIHRPRIRFIILHTLIIYVAFTVRYNALIYPFISGVAFILSRQKLQLKLVGIITGIIAIGLFIAYTGSKYKALTGTWQYSPFSGWQMANNAMYAYRYVDKTKRKPVPTRFKVLDNMIREHFDSTSDFLKYPDESLLASTVYMWDTTSPLYKYRNLQFKKESTASEFKKWASIAPLFGEYGAYIIRQYPLEFARYFLWPNSNKYYAPPVEFLGAYNMGKDSVAEIAQVWFRYKSRKVKTRFNDSTVHILDFYPILSGIMNVVFLCTLLCFILLNGFKNNVLLGKGLILAATVWIINAAFTIFASSAALRFQSFPIILFSCFSFLLLDYIIQAAKEKTEIANNTSEVYEPKTEVEKYEAQGPKLEV